MNRNKENIASIDAAKGILIILVVIGHCLERCGGASSKIYLHNAIYLFHMPMFIAISGYLTKRKDNKVFLKSILSLIEVYFVFQIIHYGTHFFENNFTFSLYRFFVMPEWTLWYLLSLITWRTFIQIFGDRVHLHTTTIVILCIVISLISGYIPLSRQLSIPRTLAFFPFFLGGYLWNDLKKSKYIQPVRNICLFAACFIIPYFLLYNGTKYNSNFTCARSYQSLHEYYTGPFIRLCYFVCAIALSYITFQLSKKLAKFPPLLWTGKNTLLIYVFHPFLIMVAANHFNNNTLLSIIVSFVIIICLYFISKLPIKYIIYPISSILEKS